MTTTNPTQDRFTATTSAADVSTDGQCAIDLIDLLQPGKQQQKNQRFQKLYPAIERALARQVPQKTIIAELEKMELHLSMGGFRSLLDIERKQRNGNGERVRCAHCGSNLPREGEGDNRSPALGVI